MAATSEDSRIVAALLLIVDDHEGFGRFASELLAGERFAVAGVVPDGESALEAVASLRPDLVLVDVQLPGIDGLDVAERLAATRDPPGVVLISTRDAADFGARLRRAPVLGFIPKHELSVDAVSRLLDPSASDG